MLSPQFAPAEGRDPLLEGIATIYLVCHFLYGLAGRKRPAVRGDCDMNNSNAVVPAVTARRKRPAVRGDCDGVISSIEVTVTFTKEETRC